MQEELDFLLGKDGIRVQLGEILKVECEPQQLTKVSLCRQFCCALFLCVGARWL